MEGPPICGSYNGSQYVILGQNATSSISVETAWKVGIHGPSARSQARPKVDWLQLLDTC